MPSVKAILIIFAMVAAAQALTDAEDVNRLSLVMRPKDLLRVDMRRLMSFQGSSINFFSNNRDVKLPGVTSDPPTVFLKDAPFHPIIVKNKKGLIFMVEADRSHLRVFNLMARDELKEVNHGLKFLSHKNIDGGIADVHLEEDSLTVLFYDRKDQANPAKAATSRYYLMNVNLFVESTEKIVSFVAPWCQNPTLKMFSPHPIDDARDFVFLVFDKENDANGVLGSAKGFTLVKVDFEKGTEEVPATNIATKMLTDILFKRELVPLRLINVLMSTQHRHTIYFVVQDADRVAAQRHLVYNCDVDLHPDGLDSLTLTNCGLFRKQPVKQFFLKRSHYIAIDGSKMEFCGVATRSCREGTIQDSWELKSVLMEGDLAVLIMSIEKTKFIFINNFRDNTLVWFFDDRSPIRPAYLFYGEVNGLTHSFLVEVPEQGLSLRDISFNPFFEVRGSQLKRDQLTNVFLEDKLVLSYDLKPVGEKNVNNLQEDRVVEVLIEPGSKEFRTKLDIVGSDLRFSENGLRRIKYFNPMSFKINWKNGQPNDTPYHFFKEWVIFSTVIVRLSCVAQKESYIYSCDEVARISSPSPIDVEKISKVENMGNLLIIMGAVSDSLVILDAKNNKVVQSKYPDRFMKGKNCACHLTYIACVFEVSQGEAQVNSVRLFSVDRSQLEEIDGFERVFLESIDRIRSDNPWEKDKKLKSATLTAFDFDDVQIEKLFVQFRFVFDGNSVRRVYGEFRFEDNPNTSTAPRLTWVGRNSVFENDTELDNSPHFYVLDSQTVFFGDSSNFVLTCYEGDSKYFFEHVEVVKLHSVRQVRTHSLVIVLFQGNLDKHFFAIFRVTQNAAKQLLHLEEIPDFDDHYRLSVIPIDDWTLGFHQYNPVSGKELPSFIYFRDGPILVSSSFDQELVVNGAPHSLRFAQDKLFDVARNHMFKSTHLVVTPETRPLSVKLKDYFSFDGNMYDIELDKHSQDAGAVLKKPLEISAQSAFLTVAPSTKPADMSIAYNSVYLVVQENRNVPLYQVFSREDPAVKLQADFRRVLPDGAICEQVALSEAHLLCLWTDGAVSMLTGFRFRTQELLTPSFILPEAMAQVNVLTDNASKLTLLYRDVGHKYVCWFELDFSSKTSTRRIIGKREMNVDDLNVLDYFFQLNENRNRLTVVMLDGHSNQLLIFHASASDHQQEPVLKRAIPLSSLDNQISSLHCLESSSNELRFYCMLVSPTHLHYLSIANVAKTQVSLYTWEAITTRKFYNVLFATALDEDANIRALADFQNFFITQANLATCKDPMLVRYSLLDASIHHSSFALPLEPFKGIVGIVPGAPRPASEAQKLDTIELFHLVAGTLHRVTLTTGEYVLKHPSPFALEGKRLNLQSRFFNNQNPSDLSFSFAARPVGKDEAKKQRNLKLVLLIVGIVLVSLFILVAVFVLLVLLRDRKKILFGANQPADETEVDISYV